MKTMKIHSTSKINCGNGTIRTIICMHYAMYIIVYNYKIQIFHMLNKKTKYYSLEIIIQLYFKETIFNISYKNVSTEN